MGVGDVLKNGWHPEGKKGGKESWRGDFKGVNQVAGWMGKGKDDPKHLDAAKNHTSKPLSQLQDPSTFAPPPKHRDYYGDTSQSASPTTSNQTQTQTQTQSIEPSSSRAPPPLPTVQTSSRPAPTVPPRAGQAQREESPEKPSGPFRVDTTGLSTANLPPPPQHRDKRLVDGAKHPSSKTASPTRTGSPAIPSTTRAGPPPPPRSNVAAAPPPTKPKPSLPPRVPPRSTVAGSASGPGGRTTNSPPPPYSETPGPLSNAQPAVGELQQRFARIRAREEQAELEASGPSAGEGAAPPPIPIGSKPR